MHEDDLTGMLRAQQVAGGDNWEVVDELKADKDRRTENPFGLRNIRPPPCERIRRNTKAADWSALYLQNPTPDEGTYFKADWLKP